VLFHHLSNLWSDESVLLPSHAEMVLAEEKNIAAGVTALELMKRAGEAVAAYLIENDWQNPCILVGCGNNGGDGLVVAEKLLQLKLPHKVIVISGNHCSPLMLSQLRAYLELGGEPVLYGSKQIEGCLLEFISDDKICNQLAGCVIDAMLGTGQHLAPRGDIAVFLGKFANSFGRVLSIDVPTGVNCDTGEVYQDSFSSDVTLCVEYVKRGLLQFPARLTCGEIKVVKIGLETIRDAIEFSLLMPKNLPSFPRRKLDDFKNKFGHVVVMAGSYDMSGAGVLAANAAIRSGAGVVTKLQPSSFVSQCFPEIIFHHIADNGKGIFTPEMLPEIQSVLENKSAWLVGCGVGENPISYECMLTLLKDIPLPVVIDASALNALVLADTFDLSKAILTPHMGEAARLLHTTTENVMADRYSAAKQISEKYNGAVVVLKGASTVIFGKSGGYVSDCANPYLATAGSGDVLAGIIVALVGQGLPLLDAARLGVFAHGMAATNALKKRDFLIASDLIEALRFSYDC